MGMVSQLCVPFDSLSHETFVWTGYPNYVFFNFPLLIISLWWLCILLMWIQCGALKLCAYRALKKHATFLMLNIMATAWSISITFHSVTIINAFPPSPPLVGWLVGWRSMSQIYKFDAFAKLSGGENCTNGHITEIDL